MKFISELLLFSALATTSANPLEASARSCPNVLSCTQSVDTCCSPKLGLIVLALQWIPNLGPDNAWTIHGLWPNKCDGSHGPSDGCDSDRNYDNIDDIVSADSNLESQMNTYWSSYKGNNPSFWSHEWNKHGTCLSTIEPRCYSNYQTGMEVRDYFKQTLALRNQYDLYKILSNQGVKPGRTYTKAQIQSAFGKGLGKSVTLKCKSKALQEVVLNFQVKGKDSFVLVDADDSGNCPSNGIQYQSK